MLSKKDQIKWNKPKRKGEVKDPDYLAWLHDQPCMVCGKLPVEVHHVEIKGMGGRNAVNDRCCLPLCVQHHRGEYSPHGRESGRFKQDWHLREKAFDYYLRYLDEQVKCLK